MSGKIEVAERIEEQRQAARPIAKPRSASPLNFSRRITELDGYRGMAVALGLFFHYVRYGIVARPPQLLGYVYTTTPVIWSGMELFFILSGFLITGILLDTRHSPNYFKTYYIRRACRILPVYFLFLGLVAVAFHFLYLCVGKPLDWVFSMDLPWYAYLSFAQNLWMAKVNNLKPAILAITWSLAVEEQFYISLPFIVKFVRRSALPYLFSAGIILAPMIRVWIAYRFPDHLWATYVLLPSRMDSLCVGALCAYYVRELEVWNWLLTNRNTLWGILFVLVAGMPLVSNEGIPFTLLWITVGIGWMSAFFVTVLLLALTNSDSFISRAMRLPVFTGLGTIAYSVFLFHLGIYCLCMWALTGHGWIVNSWKDFGVILISLCITITFCKLLWRFFEKPIIRWSHAWQH
jgi:peptidoglycan/LPS O-acetylase OafA/YrhL